MIVSTDGNDGVADCYSSRVPVRLTQENRDKTASYKDTQLRLLPSRRLEVLRRAHLLCAAKRLGDAVQPEGMSFLKAADCGFGGIVARSAK